MPQAQYRFRLRRSTLEHTVPLALIWEANGSPISDNYTHDEIDAEGLFSLWATRLEKKDGFDGWVPIYWYVDTPDNSWSDFTSAPFRPNELDRDSTFLNMYTWPVNAVTGKRMNWLHLPVQNGKWNARESTKGGFVQEATGFKPSPLQDRVYLPTIKAASGLGTWNG